MIAWIDHVDDIHIFIEDKDRVTQESNLEGMFYTHDYSEKVKLKIIFSKKQPKIEIIKFDQTKLILEFPSRCAEEYLLNGIFGTRSFTPRINSSRFGLILINAKEKGRDYYSGLYYDIKRVVETKNLT